MPNKFCVYLKPELGVPSNKVEFSGEHDDTKQEDSSLFFLGEEEEADFIFAADAWVYYTKTPQ